MKSTNQTCSTDRIDEYLDGTLNDLEQVALEEHLSACERCQENIEQRAANPNIWRDAVQMLSDSIHESTSDHSATPGEHQSKRHALGVLESLAPTDDPEMLGRLGDYEISGVVGVGGMGAVLKGFDQSLRRVVAIKVMAPHLATCGAARTRFQREARAAAAITHDNVIDTYGVSDSGPLPYLVMPFARGPSLQKRIDEGGPLSTIEVVRIGRQIASGLAAAHEQGLVHRDIKPANILLNEGVERLWITDFGVARAIDDASMTQTGVIAGTPQYMSPEQARGESVDHRSDLFSLGSVLYTACTGWQPFRSEAAYGILRRITDTDPRPICEVNPEIATWLSRIIDRLMAKHPSDRYQSAAEVADIFEGCLAHLQQPNKVELPRCVRYDQPNTTKISKPEKVALASAPSKTLPGAKRYFWTVVCTTIAFFMFAGLGVFAWQKTEPVEIQGQWAGDEWQSVTLHPDEWADGWYNGSFTDSQGRRGSLQLEWSRLQRRYNGRWKVGDEHSGSLTVRAVNSELRGAISIDPDWPTEPEVARLRDFAWQRNSDANSPLTQPSSSSNRLGQKTIIVSPIKGRVARWADGIHENSNVQKGDVIAEIVDIDPAILDRIQEQVALASRRIDTAELQLESSRNQLEAARTVVISYESQMAAFDEVKLQIAAAADASIESAKNKIVAAEASLQENIASLTQVKAEYERTKILFQENAISESAYQEAERDFNEQTASVARFEANVDEARNELTARESERSAKVAKAQADVDYASAQLNKAKADVAKTEGDVAAAQLELESSEQMLREKETELARQQSQMIIAPIDGIVSQLTQLSYLKEGDVVCVILAEAASTADEDGSSASDPVQSNQLSTTPSPSSAVVSRLPGMSGWPISDSVDATLALGHRFRELNSGMQAARSRASDEQSTLVDRYERLLISAEYELETAISILTAQLEAARKLNASQTVLSDQVKRLIEVAEAPRHSLNQAEFALVGTAAEIQQLERLLQYCDEIGRGKNVSSEDERSLILDVLAVQLDAAKKRMSLEENNRTVSRHLFEQGDAEIDDVLLAEQAEATAAAEVHKLEALLNYFDKVGMRETVPRALLPVDQGDNRMLIPPSGEQERQAMILLLESQIESAKAHLAQEDQNAMRNRQLFAKGYQSEAAYEASQASFIHAKAELDQLEIKLEYYRSYQSDE